MPEGCLLPSDPFSIWKNVVGFRCFHFLFCFVVAFTKTTFSIFFCVVIVSILTIETTFSLPYFGKDLMYKIRSLQFLSLCLWGGRGCLVNFQWEFSKVWGWYTVLALLPNASASEMLLAMLVAGY